MQGRLAWPLRKYDTPTHTHTHIEKCKQYDFIIDFVQEHTIMCSQSAAAACTCVWTVLCLRLQYFITSCRLQRNHHALGIHGAIVSWVASTCTYQHSYSHIIQAPWSHDHSASVLNQLVEHKSVRMTNLHSCDLWMVRAKDSQCPAKNKWAMKPTYNLTSVINITSALLRKHYTASSWSTCLSGFHVQGQG